MMPRLYRGLTLVVVIGLALAIGYGVWRVTDSLWGPAIAVLLTAWYVADMFIVRQPSGQDHMTQNPDQHESRSPRR